MSVPVCTLSGAQLLTFSYRAFDVNGKQPVPGHEKAASSAAYINQCSLADRVGFVRFHAEKKHAVMLAAGWILVLAAVIIPLMLYYR